MENVKEAVHRVVQSVFSSVGNELYEEWGPNDIEDWDSMGHLNLVMALGEEFNITLEFEEVMAIQKIEDIFLILEGKGIA
ncbi:MAG: hypothetical protein ACMUJM_17205 [bacterium]